MDSPATATARSPRPRPGAVIAAAAQAVAAAGARGHVAADDGARPRHRPTATRPRQASRRRPVAEGWPGMNMVQYMWFHCAGRWYCPALTHLNKTPDRRATMGLNSSEAHDQRQRTQGRLLQLQPARAVPAAAACRARPRAARQLVAAAGAVKRGEALFHAGDPFESLYAVRTRLLQDLHAAERRARPGDRLPDGRRAARPRRHRHEHHTCDAVALEDSQVCVIPYSQLEALSREFTACSTPSTRS